MGANVSIKQLRAFLAVARTASFTDAAVELNVTPSALSLLVKGLEEELGFRLLDRTTRRVTVSQAGQQFQAMAKSVIDGLEAVIRSAAEVASVQRGVVRVGGTEIIACTLIAPAIAAYEKVRPTVDVKLVDAAIGSMLGMLRNGEMEFLIGPASTGILNIDADVAVSPLFVSPFAVYCPKAHPLARRSTLGWSELARYSLIAHSFDFSSSLVPRLQEHSDTQDFDRELNAFLTARQVTNIFTGFSLASAGLGVMLAPRYLTTLARRFGLSGPALTRPSLKRVIAVYTRKNHALSPGAEDFLAFLQKQVDVLGLLNVR